MLLMADPFSNFAVFFTLTLLHNIIERTSTLSRFCSSPSSNVLRIPNARAVA